MLKIDYSLIIQIANFLFLLFILNILLFRPIRKILNQRREEMDSFQDTIGDFQDKSGHVEKELEESVLGARTTGRQAKEGLKQHGLEEENTMLQAAALSAGEKIDKAREEIEGRMMDARQSLQNEVALFSRELAEKILGRSF
jgi:F-type H+-transporting ATPase subunit b